MSALGIDAYVPLGREGKAHGAVNRKRSSEMAKKLKTKLGRARYKARKSIVEPVFGWVKRVLGFRSFSLRSLKKLQGEWSLVCMAINLRRLGALSAAK